MQPVLGWSWPARHTPATRGTVLIAGLWHGDPFVVNWDQPGVPVAKLMPGVARQAAGGWLRAFCIRACSTPPSFRRYYRLAIPDPIIIALGLGVGAMFVRLITIYLVRQDTLTGTCT